MAATKKSSSVKYGSVLDKYKDFITVASEMEDPDYLSIGPLSMNIAAGDKRGVPMGKMIQLVGKQSSGKSTLSLDIIRQFQQAYEGPVLYVDFERSLDPKYAAACGVDLSRIWRAHPDTTEVGLNIIESLVQEGESKLIIIDSVAASKPSSEESKGYEDSPKMASAAGLLTRFCTRMTPIIDNHKATIILINQLRKNFSLLSHETEIPWGGLALQYAVSLTIHLTRTGYKGPVQEVQALIKKNKVGSVQTKVDFKIKFGSGIDHANDILQLGIAHGLIKKSGSYYYYEDQTVQGEENATQQFPIDEIKERILLIV